MGRPWMGVPTMTGNRKSIMGFGFLILNLRGFLNREFKRLFHRLKLKIHISKYPNPREQKDIRRPGPGERPLPPPLSHSGFTFIELLLVLAILALLSGLVATVSMNKIRQAKESALKEDLHSLRKSIDDFYADTGKYPKKLGDLADQRYLRSIPADP